MEGDQGGCSSGGGGGGVLGGSGGGEKEGVCKKRWKPTILHPVVQTRGMRQVGFC